MNIAIHNPQKIRPLNRTRVREVAEALMGQAKRVRPDLSWHELTLVLTDDAGISRVNREALGHAGPTDVISFRYDPVPGEQPDALTAELVINVERAWAEGQRRRNWTPSRELSLYMAHGCNHLTGWDDATPRDAARMRRRELRWLRTLDVRGLIG